MATSMDDILSEKPEQPEKPAAPEREQPEAAAEPAEEKTEKVQSRRRDHQRREWVAQGRDPETGQFIAKEKPEPEKAAPPEAKAEPKKEEPAAKPHEKPAQPEFTERERALLKAAEDERRKRQALEQEFQRRMQVQPQPQPGQQPQKKGFWDDPEGYFEARERAQREHAVQTKLQTAELLARSRYKDFDEKIEKFAEMVKSTPGLAQQWLGAADPGEFAYRTAASHMALEQAGSMDKLLEEAAAKARAEERAKVEAEFKAREDAAAQKRAALPGSLSDVTGGGRKPAPSWTGPTAMDEILKH